MALHNVIKSLHSLYLKAPEIELGNDKVEEFNALYSFAMATPGHGAIAYDLPYPKYEFLHYLVEHKQVLLHGSNETGIDTLMPIRLSTDTKPIGNLDMVYACSDGIWPIFYAILNRKIYFGSTSNDCFWVEDETARRRKLYYFSIEAEWLRHQPWTDGMVYMVPRYTFRRLKDGAGAPLEEWASNHPARVLAKLRVGPEDFPFLNSVRLHQHRAASSFREEVKIAPEKLDAYTGQYEVAPGLLVRIKRSSDRLCAEADGFPPVEMQAESDHVFFIRALDLRLLFDMDQKGHVRECKIQL